MPEPAVPFRMPSLGADMDAGTILEWLVAPGAEVHRGDVVAVVQTDKADLDVEVFHDGVVAELVVPVGVKVPVGAVIAMLAPAGAVPASQGPPPAAAPPAAPSTSVAAVAPLAPSATTTSGWPDTRPGPEEVHSPVLRHLADRLHVDVHHLRGSGPGGRITRDDIERASARPRTTPRARRLARERGIDLAAHAVGGVVTGDHVLAMPAAAPPPATARRAPDRDAMRAAIARQMASSWQQIPHYRVDLVIDVDDTMAALEARNADLPAADRILPAALLLHATARAVAAVPAVNGHWIDGALRPGEGVHLATVVSLRTGGLLAPVVRDADTLTLEATMDRLRDLVTRARSGHLRASEVTGATITVTDLGEGGADSVSPIIHPPQIAIVGFGAVRREPRVVEGALAPRAVVHASLAGDHRAIDGRIGSLFLTTLARTLQEVLPR